MKCPFLDTLYQKKESAKVASFIRSHIICKHGVPHELISDKGSHFRAEVDTLFEWIQGR